MNIITKFNLCYNVLKLSYGIFTPYIKPYYKSHNYSSVTIYKNCVYALNKSTYAKFLLHSMFHGVHAPTLEISHTFL